MGITDVEKLENEIFLLNSDRETLLENEKTIRDKLNSVEERLQKAKDFLCDVKELTITQEEAKILLQYLFDNFESSELAISDESKKILLKYSEQYKTAKNICVR